MLILAVVDGVSQWVILTMERSYRWTVFAFWRSICWESVYALCRKLMQLNWLIGSCCAAGGLTSPPPCATYSRPVRTERSRRSCCWGFFFGCAPAERSGFSQLLRNVLMRAARLGDCGVRSHLKNVAFSWRWTSLLFRCVKFRQTHGSRVSRKNVPQLRSCVLRAAPSSCWTL